MVIMEFIQPGPNQLQQRRDGSSAPQSLRLHSLTACQRPSDDVHDNHDDMKDEDNEENKKIFGKKEYWGELCQDDEHINL